MFKAIGWLIKVSIFVVLVLILGNWLEFRGKTVSDQVKTHLSHAERSEFAHKLRSWAGDLTEDARVGAPRKISSETRTGSGAARSGEDLPSAERQKLRALIRELNHSEKRD